jgi:hypothetical protein
MPLYQTILERYGTMTFSLPDGTLNPYTMIPMVTRLLIENGLEGRGAIESVAGVYCYPPEWFNPFDDLFGRLRKTENTRTIHWYAKSWIPAEPKWKTSVKRFFRRVFGKEHIMRLGQVLKKG